MESLQLLMRYAINSCDENIIEINEIDLAYQMLLQFIQRKGD